MVIDEVDEFLDQSLNILEEYEQGHDVRQKIKDLTLPTQLDEDIMEVYRVVQATCAWPRPRAYNSNNNAMDKPRSRSLPIRIPRLDMDKLDDNYDMSIEQNKECPIHCCHISTKPQAYVTPADFIYLSIFMIFISVLFFLVYPPHRYSQPY